MTMTDPTILTLPDGDMLTVRPAHAADIASVVAIEEDARARSRALGFDPGQPPRPLAEIVAERVSRGAIAVATLAGATVATVALGWQPEPLWADLPECSVDALYVHGLMVRGAFAGRAIGRALLRWAEWQGATAGKRVLRLDCMASNHALRAYYTRLGFTYRGDATQHTYTGSRFEKTIGTHAPEGAAPRDA